MRRKACALLMSATLGGCMSFDGGPGNTPACTGSWGPQNGPPPVPGLAGPHGQHVPMAQPYAANPPGNAYVAQQMMSRSVPLNMVQINRGVNAGGTPGMAPSGMTPAGMTPGMSGPPGAAAPLTPIPPGGVLSPPGLPFAPGVPAGPNITPASFMQGAGPQIPMGPNMPQGPSGGIMTAQYAIPNSALQAHPPVAAQRTQIRFVRPTGMRISWFTQGPDGRPTYSNIPLEAPARYNFPQAAIYRLKLSNIEGRPGLEIYPTMEVVPSNPKTDAFLAHSSVPLEFTQEDFKQVVDGNYVTKVIYLPDPQFQDIAGTGIDEIVSTRLEPGADPIQEALRRGSILLIIRMGNVDQEAPNTPPLGAVSPLHPLAPVGPHGPGGPGGPHAAPGHTVPPAFQVPYIGNRPILPPMPGGPTAPPGGPRAPVPPPPPGLQLPPTAPLGAGLPQVGPLTPQGPGQFVPPLPPGAAPVTVPGNPFNSSLPGGVTPPSTSLPGVPLPSTPPDLTPTSVLPPPGSLATPSAAAPSVAPKSEKADVPPLPSVPPIPNTSSRGPIVPTPTASKTTETPIMPAQVLPTPATPNAVSPNVATPNVVVPAHNQGPVNVPVTPIGATQPDVVVPAPVTPTTTPTTLTPTTERPDLPKIITPEQPAAAPSLPTIHAGTPAASGTALPTAPTSLAPSSATPMADIHVPAPTAGSLPPIPSADLPPLPAAPLTPALPDLPAIR